MDYRIYKAFISAPLEHISIPKWNDTYAIEHQFLMYKKKNDCTYEYYLFILFNLRFRQVLNVLRQHFYFYTSSLYINSHLGIL